MEQYAIEPLQLKLELTESMVLDNINFAIEKMLALSHLVSFCLWTILVQVTLRLVILNNFRSIR